MELPVSRLLFAYVGASAVAFACSGGGSGGSHGDASTTSTQGQGDGSRFVLPRVDSSSVGVGVSGDASTAATAEWLAPMNAARAAVGVKPLAWDPIAAQVADDYAHMCNFEHNPNAAQDYAQLGGGSGGLGENIAAGTTPESPTTAVADWLSEKGSYDYATNTCASICGHYTQIVWAASTGVGCAHVTCNTNSPFGGGEWDFSVCDFSPPGNFVGQKPY